MCAALKLPGGGWWSVRGKAGQVPAFSVPKEALASLGGKVPAGPLGHAST